MSVKSQVMRSSLCLVFLVVVAAAPGFAGSAVIGSVTGSMNATVGGQLILPNTTLFSGDSLQVRDGVASIALGSTGRMVFGRDTTASFLRDSREVTVLLGQGNVSLLQSANGTPVRVKAGAVSVAPAFGIKTLGEVAMLNGQVVVTAKEGTLHVEANGRSEDLTGGKTITLTPNTNAPQAGGNPYPTGTAFTWGLDWFTVDTILAGASLVVTAVELSRIDNAVTNAAAADSAAAAAASAASAALSAAEAAASEENVIGCALDKLAAEEGLNVSPYVPPPGYTCNG